MRSKSCARVALITISADTRLEMREDAFGNVTHVMTNGAIENLNITVSGLIETHDTGGILRGTDERFPPACSCVPRTHPRDPRLASFARGLRAEADDDALGFLHTLMTQIAGAAQTFDEDPTNSGTSAIEAFTLRRGVCQDYAHVFIACARTAGVPARFVSGHFLRADGMTSQQAGHAWAEACVPNLGWVSFDPANCICTTDAHARVARSGSTISVPPPCAARAMAAAAKRSRSRSRSSSPAVPDSGRASRRRKTLSVVILLCAIAHHRQAARPGMTREVHRSSHTSSQRRLLYWLLSCGL